MMERMRLSEKEKKGIRVSGGASSGGAADLQAIGKVLSDRPVFAEGLGLALGKVWCPIRG